MVDGAFTAAHTGTLSLLCDRFPWAVNPPYCKSFVEVQLSIDIQSQRLNMTMSQVASTKRLHKLSQGLTDIIHLFYTTLSFDIMGPWADHESKVFLSQVASIAFATPKLAKLPFNTEDGPMCVTSHGVISFFILDKIH